MNNCKNELCIVIPCYKAELSSMERLALKRIERCFGKYDISLLAPRRLDLSNVRNYFPNAKECRMEDAFFDSFASYNRLMLSEKFYLNYMEYEYILICQQDVFVIEDRLRDFLKLDYDYIGAPMPHMQPFSEKLHVGNGGFSLRRVDGFIRVLCKKSKDIEGIKYNEDIFFSKCGENDSDIFKVAPVDVGLRFSFDNYYERLYEYNNHKLPMAIHGFCEGDRRFIKKFLDPLCDESVENNNDWEKELFELEEFVNKADRLVLFGAGDAGIVMAKFCKKRGRQPFCFLVSDGESFSHHFLEGIQVFSLSEFEGDLRDCSIIISISKRYKSLDGLEKRLKAKGANRIRMMSRNQFNAAINEMI